MPKTVTIIPLKLEGIVFGMSPNKEVADRIKQEHENPYRIMLSTPDWRIMPLDIGAKTAEGLGKSVHDDFIYISKQCELLGYTDCDYETNFDFTFEHMNCEAVLYFPRPLIDLETDEYWKGHNCAE